jgi:hypothetical protein
LYFPLLDTQPVLCYPGKKNEWRRNHQLLIDGIGNFFEFWLKANKTPHLDRLFACKLELPAASSLAAEFNRWHFLETLFKQGNSNRNL